jgi:hypothetical protein
MIDVRENAIAPFVQVEKSFFPFLQKKLSEKVKSESSHLFLFYLHLFLNIPFANYVDISKSIILKY